MRGWFRFWLRCQAALVGVDVVDTLERPHGERSVEDFFGNFTDNFTAAEWASIRGTPDELTRGTYISSVMRASKL